MNIIKYNNLCNFLNKFLKKNSENENIFSIQWAHLLRYHDQEIKSHQSLEIKFTQKSFIKLISLIFQIFYKFSLSNSFKNFKNNIKSKTFDTIVISHLINVDQLRAKRDFYFPDIARTKKSLTFLINHTKLPYRKVNKMVPNNTIVFSKTGSLPSLINIFYKCLKGFWDIKIQIKSYNKKNYPLLKKIQNEALSTSTFLNHLLKNDIQNLIKIINPKKIFFTYEGYVYERIIISAARGVSKNIKCIGYQHSAIFSSQNILYKSFSSKYDPDCILCTGQIPANYLKKNIENKNIKIQILGTQKRIFFKKNKESKACIVVPEGYFSEIETLLNFSIKITEEDPNIPFIFRLHPNIINNNRVKMHISNKLKMYKNFNISKGDLKDDLKKSKVVLYRGSTVSIQAGCIGILPIYLKGQSDISIDPLFAVGENKLKIDSVSEFLDLYYNNSNHNIQNYCKRYYNSFDKKLLRQL